MFASILHIRDQQKSHSGLGSILGICAWLRIKLKGFCVSEALYDSNARIVLRHFCIFFSIFRAFNYAIKIFLPAFDIWKCDAMRCDAMRCSFHFVLFAVYYFNFMFRLVVGS